MADKAAQGWTSYNGTWLSLADQPTATSTTVKAGSAIALQLNTFSYRYSWSGTTGANTELQSVQLKNLSLTPSWGGSKINVIGGPGGAPSNQHWDLEMVGYRAKNQQSTLWPNKLTDSQSAINVAETKTSGFVFAQPLKLNKTITAPSTAGTSYTITASMSSNGMLLKDNGDYLCMEAYDNELYPDWAHTARPDMGNLYNFNSGKPMRGWNSGQSYPPRPNTTLCPTGSGDATITFNLTVTGDAQLDGTTSQPASPIVVDQSATWMHTLQNNGEAPATGITTTIHQSKKSVSGAVLVADKNVGSIIIAAGKLDVGASASANNTYTSQAGDIGDTICEWLTWNSDTPGSAGNGQTAPTCIVVAKQPKVQILGGNLRVGGEIYTGSTLDTSAGKTYGSWGEYGVFINGKNDGDRFGSGASLRGGGSNDNPLTFSNVANPTGQFGDRLLNSQDLTNVLKTSGLPACTPTSLSTGGCTTNAGSLSLNGNSNVTGTVYINAPNATVTINGDIKYASGIASIGQLPQVVIYAKSIVIKANVGQVDAWLLTPTGTSGGCAPARCALTTSNTAPASGDKQLFIHGPVATKDLSLPRGAGSDDAATQDKAAETFDLRADSYLWMYGQAAQNYSPQTSQVTNLPPRY